MASLTNANTREIESYSIRDSTKLLQVALDFVIQGVINSNYLHKIYMNSVPSALLDFGFTDVRPISEKDQPRSKLSGERIKYGHFVACLKESKYVIRVVTRKKYSGKGELNYRYNLVRKNEVRSLVKEHVEDEEKAKIYYSDIRNSYDAIPAWVSVSIDNLHEIPTYTIYFETVEKIKWNLGIPMRKHDLDDYICLTKNNKVSDLFKPILSNFIKPPDSDHIDPTCCDILIIIPLPEEFDYFKNVFQVSFLEKHDVIHYYRATPSQPTYNIFCICLDETGPTHAGVKTVHAILHCNPYMVVLLGIGGALDGELLLGDVVVGDEINLVHADAKAVDVTKNGEKLEKYELQFGGKRWVTKATIKSVLNNFPRRSYKLHEDWQNHMSSYRSSLDLDEKQLLFTRKLPRLTVGNIASGDIVGASKSFSAELLAVDRKLKVLEMEAAGVATACLNREQEIDFLIIRGLSDFADGRKKELDDIKNGAFRDLAMTSATQFFLSLIQSKGFSEYFTDITKSK